MFRPLMFAALVFALPAEAFTAQNGMRVRPLDAQTFIVEFPSPEAETQYLCAAGDYVIRAWPDGADKDLPGLATATQARSGDHLHP